MPSRTCISLFPPGRSLATMPQCSARDRVRAAGRPGERQRARLTRQPLDRIIPWARSTYILSCPCNDPPPSRLRTSLFEDAVAIVEQEYATDLSLDDIARRVASSRRQLQRAYAEIGDTTFRDHLTRVRMERAAELLAPRPHGARGRPPRRLPPAGPVREGVPPPPRRGAVRLPRAARSRGRRSARTASARAGASPPTRPRHGRRATRSAIAFRSVPAA